MKLTKFVVGVAALGLVLLLGMTPAAHAQLPGAIFTTLPDGSAVNFNIYPSKFDVYLDGGPPPGAPQHAAGLPDGTYVFQITDPSGKSLLSTDKAACRRFTVAAGIITGVVAAGGCEHLTGLDVDHGATTVQMMPYLDTPNNGGEYKAWATPVEFYLQGCAALGIADGLGVVDCGKTGGDVHGFIPSHSKTDNFKARGERVNREIDTKFTNGAGNLILGVCETWIDTLGVSNTRCADPNPAIGNLGWAHVENVENGIHEIIITGQPGCTNFTGGVSMYVNGKLQTTQTFVGPGPVTLDIPVKNTFTGTITISVYCN